MVCRFIIWFFLTNSLLFWLFGFQYINNIFSSPTLFSNYTSNYSGVIGRIFVVFFWINNYLSFMLFLAFVPAIFLLILSCFLSKKQLFWMLCVLFSTANLVLLIVDTRVYLMFKFHLNLTIFSMFFHGDWRNFFDFSTLELVFFALLVFAILGLEIFIAFLVWNKVILKERLKVEKTIFVLWLGSCLFTYFTLMLSVSSLSNLFTQQTSNIPLFYQVFVHLIPNKNANELLKRLSETNYSQRLFSNDKMQYPLHPMQCAKPDKPLNLILIMVDSLRYDSLEYMPKVRRFAEQSWQFKNHLSGGNATQPGVFSIFYSIPGSYWTAALKQNVPPVLTNLLIQFNYSIQIFWSNTLYNPPFNKTVFSGLKNLEIDGSKQKDVGARDRDITKKATEFLRTNKDERQFFLYLFYDAPHGFCAKQKYSGPYQPTMKNCSRLSFMNNFNAEHLYNRYLNAVDFDDNEIGKVLKVIEQQGYLENSIVIFTSDHGQEFDDNKQDFWGHGGNFTRAQIQVPLLIHWPGQPPREINYLTTSYDLLPTLAKRLFACANPNGDYSIGQDLFDKTGPQSFIISGSYMNMGIVEADRLTTLQTSGNFDITTIHADPLPLATPRMGVLKQALDLMRKYYAKRAGERIRQ
ncbi:DUF3413 domain-containing protein [Legionella massiliensis]|nr:sulfatase-like hydrolase/transferase [Legionella massiliensis]